MTREEIYNNLESIISDIETSFGTANVANKSWNYRDYVYVKQAMLHLKTPDYHIDLTTKADFGAIETSLIILLSSFEKTTEQLELMKRISELIDDFKKNHLDMANYVTKL